MTAVWQVEFHMVPKRAVASAPNLLAPGALAESSWWNDASFPADHRTRLAAFMTPGSSGVPNTEAWGDEDGNRIEVRSEGGRVARVRVRVDVRRVDARFGAALILLVRAADAVLVRRDGLVVEPSINAYSAALRGSSAWRYASDPVAWLAAQAKIAESDEDES